ncbi:DksA-like zinc-finger protein [Pseudomonas phage PspYZU05]|uniref:Putative transcriptional regulator n=1 Tax=Pseudomonas phage PspYZU05 TaxID=1983556 RepID=A0A2U7NLQ8_9CAUD|nr:DksA-like zinc-finger protein [Pseudomonas phage PspYZU05]ASD51958.1 putative transcriptional regulator [Pseudomonas phage PspYZU05]
MASGFGSCDNFQDTIKATVDNAIDFARSNIHLGESLLFCEECDEEIPEKRRNALVVRCCIDCQDMLDKKSKFVQYNRRASKDSQLR